ncbi:MAG: YidC/Oxa1 family insertase periplasmic-domain containing protein [Polyangiaceae bacterium]|nr:YidC/Oxa1 family insertase periplasmic-domain containing protein [Polyangiaceae bacterium]
MPDGVFAGIAETFKPQFGKPIGPIELVTTKNDASRMPLRASLKVPGADAAQQTAYDDLDFKLSAKDGKSCTFVYEERKIDRLYAALATEKDDAKKADLQKQINDAKTSEAEQAVISRVTKVVSATGKPFELAVDMKVENLGAEPKKHRLAIEQTSWRTHKETQGSLGRQSDWMTDTIAATAAKTAHHATTDFEPGDFTDKDFTAEKWRRGEGEAKWAAVSASFMAAIVIPESGPAAPAAETLIEERWNWGSFQPRDEKDPDYGHIYRARLAYPEKELKTGESVDYRVVSFIGPKERELLAAVGRDTSEVINLGTFAFIGKTLIWYLYKLRGLVGSWGWAICLMTITVRVLLFPLSITQIKSTVKMRQLKPEIDEINERYKDQTTQKGLALQELYKKHGVNPVIGCLPMLLQMPVWFALYASLQTAVELYNVSFGPFIPDLSSPGKYFIIPAVLGMSSFFQQKIMPMQGDPAQQKMMLYMMPTIFTVMMLFLPAGLGVYMLTNTWLGILQQLMVERYMKSRVGPSGGTGIVVKEKGTQETSGDRDKRRLLERGKARG